MFLETFLYMTILVWMYMTIWFIYALIKKRNDIADIAWGLGFIMVAISSYILNQDSLTLQIIPTILILIWGIRLSSHIYKRNKNKPEDYRYQEWRNAWGKWFLLRSYGQVFLLQGFLLLVISLPIIFINSIAFDKISPWYYSIGILIWTIGFLFESISDSQLKKFISKKENAGKIMKYGLWKYSRHPNYFGEVTCWWGLWIITLATVGSFWTILGPLTITFLILKVSGVPLLEKRYENNIEFQEYKKTTSVFFPLPPKN